MTPSVFNPSDALDIPVSQTILTFMATKQNWTLLSQVIEEQDITKRQKLTLLLICEEIYTNITKYAYDTVGKIRVTIVHDTKWRIRFCDWGRPYNPIKSPAPNTTQSIKQRKIGGLGLFLVKRKVQEISYTRQHKQNILTVVLK